ncbi:hypothetical protein CHX26_08925 [Porphyrobacter sp. HT-58-2]|uniref:DUF11 domain-containing protein n=1 Tax=Porphyrobacter sp. HT-58-2 TaxID=2023229 RepID=UPI000CDCB55F|nr:DUF11 domain-containing protein [Porphyrobacter sp. HT-58-2]AUX70915.1 hypothetical protein CHX26_08925 [Porphyrobacter sp. HT-58-2]
MLLPLGVPQEGASAQTNNDGAAVRSITNIAEATWDADGSRRRISSNPVRFDVSTLPAAPPVIQVFRRSPGTGAELVYIEPRCSTVPNQAQLRSDLVTASLAPAGGPISTTATARVVPTSQLRGGEPMFFEITAAGANRDPGAVDSMTVVLTTLEGDHETITVFETAANSGVFAGSIDTMRIPPPLVQEDCRISVGSETRITIAAMRPDESGILVQTEVAVLVDPFGVVFDSETGEPVDGARVALVNADTGAPATVFAEDGVTAWPSSMISGQAVTDGSGRSVMMGPGEFWFPLTTQGRFRLVVTPPDPYTAPSAAPRDVLARITRPDGRPYVIRDGSFGDIFVLDDPAPFEVDIPVDRPSLDLGLAKTASRTTAAPGDVVFYAVTVRNPDPARVKRAVTLTDTPSRWLRLRRDTIRINGAPAPQAVTISPDGRVLTIALGDLAAGASARVTYAMTVRPDAPPGRVLNDAQVTDSLGRLSRASAAVDLRRDGIADRMTIIGRITAGDCTLPERERSGIAGVRIMLEDGSFAVTDADGRYHFEGVVPGTHVVQVSRMTLPDGARMIDCSRSTRNAGSAFSRLAIGQGGSLVVADFHAVLPAGTTAAPAPVAPASPTEKAPATPVEPAAAPTDFLMLGDGEDGFLAPAPDANPRAPAVRVVIRHRRGQSVELLVDGKPVDPLAFDGTQTPEKGKYAISQWRGVPLINERTMLEARIINSYGEVSKTFTREVFFTRTPAKVEFLPAQSNLVADGRTRPVVTIRVLDRNGRPLREGISGNFTLNAPYQSAEQIDRQQLNQLTGMTPMAARWVVEGEDGIARIELAPTMVSGSLRLDFAFNDGEITRRQELEAWIEPGDIEWTIIGLVEGTLGARSVADNMERAGQFDSDLGDDARVALYAKGRVLGKYLLTLAYDSARQREDQRVLGALDPTAYYTVFGDASARQFDAATREKLYVRIETSTFYALYGDFQTAFNQTRLANYNRTATGVKAEARVGQIKAQGFAAEIASRFQRQEIQGQGISGPYSLASRRILPNSERVTIEVRDRFRPELIISTRALTRFADYDIDLLSGTIRFAAPVLSRDENLNPQFIVIEFETDGAGEAELNAGVRADWTSANGKLRIGASAITDAGIEGASGQTQRTDIGAVDLLARIGDSTEIRAELGVSRREGEAATGWLVEAQHQTAILDLLAYARQIDGDYGIGQQNAAERGRRKIGVDGRVLLSQQLNFTGSLWQDEGLVDQTRRRAAQGQFVLTRQNTDLRLGLTHFNDRLADGSNATSTVLEAGATQRLMGNKLELSAGTAIALGKSESLDLPARHRLGLRYAITQDVRLVGTYELADGENLKARQLRGGIEVAPWQGGQIVTTLGQETIGENGNRSFAAFGLSQTLQISQTLTVDATVDSNRTIGGNPGTAGVINPAQPPASGGQLTGGLLFEDFTAVTFGAAWRKDRWSITARGEVRDGEMADRKGAQFGAIRQLGEGSLVGSGITWTLSEAAGGAKAEILDASIAFAHRPDASPLAMLGRVEFRSDRITGGVAGEIGGAGGAGRTALVVDGDATARRLVASLSANFSPRGQVEGAEVRRHEFGLFLGARHNLDRFEGTEFSGTSVLVGADARIGIGEKFELGASATVRSNVTDKATSFAYGPTIGVTPVKGMLVTVGYNIEGFRDGDFGAARNSDKGVFAAVRMAFDADSFSFLGLGR